MNKQEIFTKIVNHLRVQGKPALNIYDDCCYKTESGLKCAVGCLIDEDEYSDDLENCKFDCTDEVQNAVSFSIGMTIAEMKSSGVFDMLSDFQKLHDLENPSQWENHFKKMADGHGCML